VPSRPYWNWRAESNKMKEKKIILSTNLPNINDIDSALVRPGRCFSIIHTRSLNKEEANTVASLIGQKLSNKEKFSLAEIYNS